MKTSKTSLIKTVVFSAIGFSITVGIIIFILCRFDFITCAPVTADRDFQTFHFSYSTANLNFKNMKEVGKAHAFGFGICLKAFKGRISDIVMTVQLPPEVEKRHGEISWEGSLEQGQEKCLTVSLKAKEDIERWSKELRVHAELVYEGRKYHRDWNLSKEGLKDTDGWDDKR